MLTLDDIILDEFGEDHILLKSLIKSMLIIDPYKRPSASSCLQHAFFHKNSSNL